MKPPDYGLPRLCHKNQYGSEKGESVFYASANKGTITGIEKRTKANKGGLISGFPKLARKI